MALGDGGEDRVEIGLRTYVEVVVDAAEFGRELAAGFVLVGYQLTGFFTQT